MHYKATKTTIETMEDSLFGWTNNRNGTINDENGNGNKNKNNNGKKERIYYGISLAQALPFPKRFLKQAEVMRDCLQEASDKQASITSKSQQVWKQKKQIGDLYEALVHIGEIYNKKNNSFDIEDNEKVKQWLIFLQHQFIRQVSSSSSNNNV